MSILAKIETARRQSIAPDSGHAAARVRRLNALQAEADAEAEREIREAYEAQGLTPPKRGRIVTACRS
jgi:hypothetical protein